MRLPSLQNLLPLMLLLIFVGCDRGESVGNAAAATDRQESANVPAIQGLVDLGVIFQGQTGTYNQWIKNRSGQDIRVEKVKVSCDCLSVQLSQQQIAAKDRVLVTFCHDGTKEPEFTGNLAIVIELFAADMKQVGEIRAAIDVIKNPPEGQSESVIE